MVLIAEHHASRGQGAAAHTGRHFKAGDIQTAETGPICPLIFIFNCVSTQPQFTPCTDNYNPV